jgi:aspartate aminotransferase
MTSTAIDLSSPSVFIGRQGNGTISFGSGQPDLPPPTEATDRLDVRHDLRYGLIQGELPLREALSGEYPDSCAENFVITNGASEALDLIFRVLAAKTDGAGSVILPRPYYYSYPHLVRFAGLTPVFTDLIDGRINRADLEAKIDESTCAILINSPSNPTGRIEAIETLKRIEEISGRRDIYVISDEVYKDLIYERENYLIKGAKVITVNSFSKTYAMCGVRVGYLWSRDQAFVDAVIEYKTHTSMNTNLVGQDMALNAMGTPRSYVDAQLAVWHRRRDLIYDGLRALSLELWKPEGAFYVFPAFDRPRELVERLFVEYKVIVYLGEWFGAPKRIRLSYALDESEIEEGLDRIGRCIREL